VSQAERRRRLEEATIIVVASFLVGNGNLNMVVKTP
jgi:hypothetical protein